MNDKRFWDVIGFACQPGGDEVQWYDRLVEQLVKLDPEDIVAFDRHFDELTARACTVDLWGAAYLINGGASDDGFYYFRCWLVGMGKRVFEAALAAPDSLADVVGPDRENEAEAEIYSVARRAWQRKGLPEDEFDRLYESFGPRPIEELKGEDWDYDDDDEVRRRFPRLAAIYLLPPEETE